MGRWLPHHRQRFDAGPGGLRALDAPLARVRRDPGDAADVGLPLGTCQGDQSRPVLLVPRLLDIFVVRRVKVYHATHAFARSQEKWAKNLYIAGVAYGRTVS